MFVKDRDVSSLDNEHDEVQSLFEFVDTTLFAPFRSTNGFSKNLLKRCRDYIYRKASFQEWEPYFKGQYLYSTRPHRPRVQVEIATRPNDDEAIFPPDEFFEPFVQVDKRLTLCRNESKAFPERAHLNY